MGTFFAKNKTVILILAIALIGFVVYNQFFKPETDNGLVTRTVRQGEAIVGSEILTALNQVQVLRLSKEVFAHPVFRLLTDQSRDIREQPVGRNNPFAPLGAGDLQTASTTNE